MPDAGINNVNPTDSDSEIIIDVIDVLVTLTSYSHLHFSNFRSGPIFTSSSAKTAQQSTHTFTAAWHQS